jgi:hypothetical protein
MPERKAKPCPGNASQLLEVDGAGSMGNISLEKKQYNGLK